jgi:hypothetical protein
VLRHVTGILEAHNVSELPVLLSRLLLENCLSESNPASVHPRFYNKIPELYAVEMAVLCGTSIIYLGDTFSITYTNARYPITPTIMTDLQYLFHQHAHWRLADIPDSQDPGLLSTIKFG